MEEEWRSLGTDTCFVLVVSFSGVWVGPVIGQHGSRTEGLSFVVSVDSVYSQPSQVGAVVLRGAEGCVYQEADWLICDASHFATVPFT